MRLLVLIFCCSWTVSFAQNPPDLKKIKNQQERLNTWANYCDELIGNENYTQLRIVGRKGITMTSNSDFKNLSLFYFYTGVTFDYGVESDSAAFYLEKSERFGRKCQNNKRVFEALKQLDYVYANYGESAKRKRVIREFETILDTTSSPIDRYNIYEVLANYHISNGSYEEGLSKLLRGIKIRRKLLPKGNQTDSINFGVQLISVAELYIGLNKYDLAIDYLSESEAFIFDYKDAYAHVRKDFIDAFLLKNEIGKAFQEYRKLEVFLKKETSISCWSMLVESDIVFAKFYREKGNFSKAMQCVNHARELAPKYAGDFLKAQIDYTTGSIYLGLKNYDKALFYLKAAEPTVQEDDPEVKSWLKKSLAETYAGLGNWQLAYQYTKEYSRLQDALLTEKSKKNVAEMEAFYQNEKKQLEINQLSAKNTINDLKIKNSNRQKLYFIVVIIAVLIISAMVYIQSRNRKKNNIQLQLLNSELAQANSIKARFFSIINHDLRSPISNLIHFLHIQQDSPELLDASSKKRLETKTLLGAENLLRSMEDMLLWSKGQMENFKPVSENINLNELFTDLSNHFSSEERIELKIDFRNDLQLFTDRNYLQTILRNLTGNAIKALEKIENPTITWTAVQTNESVILSISDNGMGATQSQFKALYDENEVVGIKTGLGLHLIRDLAKAIDCAIDVETNSTEGTVISLSFVVETH